MNVSSALEMPRILIFSLLKPVLCKLVECKTTGDYYSKKKSQYFHKIDNDI